MKHQLIVTARKTLNSARKYEFGQCAKINGAKINRAKIGARKKNWDYGIQMSVTSHRMLRLWVDSQTFLNKFCPNCGNQMNMNAGGKTLDNCRWRCPRPCRKELSIPHDTFFEKGKLPLSKIIDIIYYWSYEEASVKKLNHELGCSDHTVTDWKNYLRDICAEYFFANPQC